MLAPSTIVAFLGAALLLALAPGPDNLFVLTQSALHGRSSGLLVTLGLCTGLIVHTLAVALGVAVLVQSSALAFTLLKLAGAGYLLYLGWQAWRAPASEPGAPRSSALRPGQLYRRGILMNLSNPKVSVFFLAFLPQFADPGRGALTLQLVALGGLFICATLLVFGGIALLAGSLGPWLQRSAAVQRLMQRLAGAVFVGLALKLAGSQR